ncbi:5-azacytidine-induced protein 2 isoform X1 [Notolabrus celidotus]|uniref:5-azacytidine-induced protein 2 isoform X1 n=1 Tax=Notolabrus celidotus TaxID=1203425 RepID=UPI00149026A8|nr:5-azacytidine-induced protein 2 isoform X1 [Notolabrus celidotus]XP_034554693.1 5-azacytidine-induced protein 2 isoform X1 [Notolabrus celidotus]XP_034554694.1 5-azacytidine-induced protein 2 isoform X1 [Notolabrus celidotus]
MEPLAVDDDICILKHETAYTASGESPVSVCAGDESVASHFALVTAYEDIKKRLRDTERENTLLRKRVKQLEDKLFRPDAPPSEGPQYVNKAFSAYRGIYIEKEDLQMELNKLKKEKSESERQLTEQLQAKELELLQLKTEMETSQGTVMKSLNSPQDYWQVDRVGTEQKIHKLQDELERVTLENNRLLERSGEEPHGLNGPDLDQSCDAKYTARERSMQQTYESLSSEVTRLHSELKHQTGLIRKLRPLISESRQVPIQCRDDVEKNNHHAIPRVSVPRPPSAPPLPSCSGRPCPPVCGPSGTLLPDSLREDCWYNGPWPSQSCSGEALLLGNDTCSVVLPPPPLNQASLDDSSRSFPSPPKPSDAMFWEGHSATSNSSSSIGNCTPRSPPNAEWTKPY